MDYIEKLPLTLGAHSMHYNCLFNQTHNKCGHTMHTDYHVINSEGAFQITCSHNGLHRETGTYSASRLDAL